MIVLDSIQLNSIDDFVFMIEEMTEPAIDPVLNDQEWTEVVELLQEMERGYFAASAGPDGVPWVPLRPYTIRRKGHATILRETWELLDSLTGHTANTVLTTTPISLEFGTQREWAWWHQHGTARMPPRPFIGMSDDGLDRVVGSIADSIVRQMFLSKALSS